MSGRGPVPAPLLPLARIVEPAYRMAVRRRNARFDRGIGVTRFPVPVISVGNLTVGGVGKTPMCQHLLGLLHRMGHRPALVMRGYAARPGALSDEQAEYVDRFPGVPVVAHPRRAEAISALLACPDVAVDCILLDDGFQHRFVHRDVDLVLIDATRETLRDRCLPAGWLREPVESLRRADAVVLTRTDQCASEAVLGELRARLGVLAGAPIVSSTHHWSCMLQGEECLPASALEGRRVVLAAAIGNPDALAGQVASHGGRVVASVLRRDHHAWTAADVGRVVEVSRASGADAVVTTCKDWVKLRSLELGAIDVPMIRPRVELRVTEGGEVLEGMIVAALGRDR